MNIYHGNHLRKGRTSETGRPYLVTTVTLDRLPLFCDWHMGLSLVDSLRNTQEHHYADTLAWVVMPDHLHWLVTPVSESLDAIVRRVKSCSARAINQNKGTTGSFWQKCYHDHAVRKEEDIRATARYIIANPLRAGIVEHIGDYPLWDSVYL